MSIREEVELDLSSAESSLDDLGRDLESVASGFRESMEEALGVLDGITVEDISVEVEADITDAEAQLEALEEEEVAITGIADIDFESALSALDELEEAAENLDAQTVTVQVEVDGADQATSELNDLDSSARRSSDASLAAGASLADLGQDARGATSGLLAAAASLAGVTLGIEQLFTNALEAESAQQSFEARTGSMADELERLDSAALGFDTTLGDLSIALGSSDEETRLAVARIAALGNAEGFAADRTDALVESIVGIAKNARETNPELGSLGSNIETLGTRLQRGGRFASAFGVSLQVDDILARAAENTGKLETEVSLLEKTEAAAQLATEQLGGSLGELNTENVAVTFDSLKVSIEEALEPLGAPLISPVFELLESMAPIIEDVAAVLADVGVIAVEALEPIIDAAAPLVEIWTENQQAILQELQPAIQQLAEALAVLLVEATPLIEEFSDSFVEAAPAVAALISLVADLAGTIALFLDGAEKVPGVFDGFLSVIPLVGPAVAQAKLLGSVFGEVGDEQSGLTRAVAAGTEELIRSTAAAEGFTDAEIDAAIAASVAIDGTANYALTLEALRRDAQLATFAEEALAEEQLKSATAAEVSTEQFLLLARAIAEGQIPAEEYQAIADRLGVTLEGVTGFAEGVTAAIDEFTANVLEKIPQVSSVIDGLEETFQASPDAIIASLQESQQAIADFQTNVAILIAFGFDDIARLILEHGPEFGNELVNTLAVGRPELAGQLEGMLEDYQTTLTELERTTREDFAPALLTDFELAAAGASEGFDRNLTLEDATAQSIAASKENIDLAAPELRAGAEAAGSGATEGYGTDLDFGGATQTAADEAQAILEQLGLSGNPLFEQALESGSLIGNTFAIGMGNAMTEAAGEGGFLNLQFRAAMRDLEAAIRDEAEANSPSKVFARIGEDLMLGMADGVDAIGLPDFGLDNISARTEINGAPLTSVSIGTLTIPISVSGADIGDPTELASAIADEVKDKIPLAVTEALLRVEVKGA